MNVRICLNEIVRPGDGILTLGAGNAYRVGERMISGAIARMAKVQTRAHQPRWKRKLNRALHILKWTLIAALLGIAGFDLYCFLFLSDFFVVQKIEIEGCIQTSEEEFIQLAEVPEKSNLFLLPTRRMAERIRLHPWVEETHVVRVLPQTIRIVIQERIPLAATNSTCDGQIYGIDADGVILPEPAGSGNRSATHTSYFDLPIITGLPSENIYPGNQLCDLQSHQAIEILQLLRTLDSKLLTSLSEVNIDATGDLTLFPFERSGAIYLGKENIDQRVWRLAKVWQYLETHRIHTQYIDCRFDLQGIVTRPENLSQEQWSSLPKKDRNFLLVHESQNEGGGQVP